MHKNNKKNLNNRNKDSRELGDDNLKNASGGTGRYTPHGSDPVKDALSKKN